MANGPKIKIGDNFGLLTVVERASNYVSLAGTKHSRWKCECLCGNVVVVRASSLSCKDTKSCGCYREEYFVTHGLTGTAEWWSWAGMRQRCLNPAHASYANYGGRGIFVCEAWLRSFEAFLQDMGKKPSDQYSLERIDNDGPYSKDNCKWENRANQAFNQRMRKENTSGVVGVSFKGIGRWEASINEKGAKEFLGTFATLEEAAEVRWAAERRIYGRDKKKLSILADMDASQEQEEEE